MKSELDDMLRLSVILEVVVDTFRCGKFYLIGVVSILLVLANSANSEPRLAKPKITPPALTAAHPVLRAAPATVTVTRRGGGFELRHANVEVRNLGDGMAREVQVVLRTSAGISIPLRGPRTISPRGSAVYVSAARIPLDGPGPYRATMTCQGCRK